MTPHKFTTPILFLILSITAIGCASTGFLMAKPKVTFLNNTTYPPKEKDTEIDVFVTNLPTRKYTEFAFIDCGDTSDKWNIEQLKIKAREIGADAIIIVGKSGSSGIGTPIGGAAVVTTSNYGMRSVAIKYVDDL